MLVVDASVLVVALGDDGADGDRARARLRGEELVAPESIDLEVVSVLRRQLSAGALDARRAARGARRAQFIVDDLRDLPMQRAAHRPLLPRGWELRDNLTAYDAAYVALAEAIDSVLLTADTRLANAPSVMCPIEVLRP